MKIELVDYGEEFSVENQEIIMLNFVPHLFKDVKNALKCGRDGLKLNTMVFGLRIRDSELKKEHKELRKRDKRY